MKLNALERAVALGLLPEKGDFSTLKTIEDARRILSLSEVEVEEFDYKVKDGRMFWNAKGNEEKEIELSKFAVRILEDKLKDLNTKKELTANHLTLYEKFVKSEE